MSDAVDPRNSRNPEAAGILAGIEVLDLSWGISGPMTGMLLADHGARVTRIEAPAGDPFAELSGSRCGREASGGRPSTFMTKAIAMCSSRWHAGPTS